MKTYKLTNIMMLAVFFFGQLPMPSSRANALAQTAPEPAVQAAIALQSVPVTATAEPAITSTPTNNPTESAPIATGLSGVLDWTSALENSQNKADYQISISSSPEFIQPGGQFTLNWSITGGDLAGYDLLFSIPENVTFKPDNSAAFDETMRTYRVKAGPKSGKLYLSANISAEMPINISARLVTNSTSSEMLQSVNKQPIAITSASFYEKASVNNAGGEVSGLNGKVKVYFPSGAVADSTDVFIHNPLPESMPGKSLSGHPFEITARSTSLKTKISHFDKNLEIELSYADEAIPAELENDLMIYWYNTQTLDWEALPTSVDRETKTLYAESNHFTVFDFSVNSWQAAHLPSLDASQVSSSTGAATHSIPIEVPPGPGGFKPELNLSYNSQIVDNASTLSQSSWVGMGWSLDIGGIERNSNGSDLYTPDDTFMLTINGISTNLVFDGSSYHMGNENYWKVEKIASPDSWKVTDKSGNSYYFEKATTLNYYPEEYHCAKSSLIIRWSLTRKRNIFGQEIKYNYADETKQFMIPQWRMNKKGNWVCGGTTNYEPANTATFLESIEYGNNHYRVRFVREARSDYNTDWATNTANYAFERTRLKDIFVEYDDPNKLGAYETPISKYSLEYFANVDTANLVFPGATWTAGGKTPTLKKVTQYDGGGIALPANEFSYVDDDLQHTAPDDNLHLKKAKNGYGGDVTFVYERWGMPGGNYPGYTSEYHMVAHNYGKPNMPCRTGYSGFSARNPPGDTSTCSGGGGQFSYGILNGEGITYGMAKYFVKPGGLYRVWAEAGVEGGSSTLALGIYDGTSDHYLSGLSGVIELSPLANQAEGLFKETGSGKADIYKYKFELLTSGWRVASKTLTAGEQANTYSYAYSGEAVNTHENTDSFLLCTDYDPLIPPNPIPCHEYFPEYSEFRGHRQVTETAPDGQQTVTYFFQDYLQKGKPEKVIIQTNTGRKISETIYSYGATTFTNFNNPVVPGCFIGDCIFHGLAWNWTYTDTVEKRVYKSDGTYEATLQDYNYSGAYGNQSEVISKSWNGTSWDNFRKSVSDVFPNSAPGIYLVDLPARQALYAWENGSWQLTSESLNIYDLNTTYNQIPTQGVLKAVRTLVKNADYSQVTFGFDAWGNVSSQTSYRGYGSAGSSPSDGTRTKYVTFDSVIHAYPVTMMDEKGYNTTITYDYALGVPTSETDQNGQETRAHYDGFGRITDLIRPGDSDTIPTMKFVYENLTDGFRTSVQQRIDGSRYVVLGRTYDGMGRQTLQTNGSKVGGVYTLYNSMTTLYVSATHAQQSAPYGPGESPLYTETVFDFASQSTTISAPDGTQTITSQDGLSTTVLDAKGQPTTRVQDAWGRIISVIPPAGPRVTYSYDRLDRLISATHGGASTTLEYDNAGRKTHMSDADMGDWSYVYDALGNLIQQTDARGCQIAMSYDDLNRILNKTSSGSGCGEIQTSDTYYYDEGSNNKGRRTHMTDASGSTSWSYDARGQMTAETKTISGMPAFTTGWSYNSAGAVVTTTYPDGEAVTNGYNDRGLLTNVASSLAATYLNSMQYDSSGRIMSMELGAGLISKSMTYFAWNAAGQGGRMQNMQTVRLSDSLSLQDLGYAYDANGNILSISDSLAGPQTQGFEYDSLDRLTSASATGGTDGLYNEGYTYNPATGNLQTKAGVTLSYNDPDHAHAVSSTSDGNSYAYDANGNQVTRSISGVGTYTLTYNAENQMTSVSGPNGLNATFIYDGDGRRVKSVIGTTTTWFVGDMYEVTDGAVTKYYYAGGQRIAMRSNGVVSYILGDHLGSTSLTTDAAGLVAGEMRYTAWGSVRYDSGSISTRYQYTGQASYAADFGLLFYQARWYDPYITHFTSPDSIIPEQSQGTQAWDRFAYSNNNPVRYTDPSGHCVGPLVIVCVALIEASPAIAEAVFYAATAYMIASEATHNAPIVNGQQVLIGIVVPGPVVPIPELDLNNASILPKTLYRFGGGLNGSSPGPNPKPGDFDLTDLNGTVGPEFPPAPNGLSTYSDPSNSGLSGQTYSLPKGYQLPDGIGVVADGRDVLPYSIFPETHHTIFPIEEMSYETWVDRINKLPWEVGPKFSRPK